MSTANNVTSIQRMFETKSFVLFAGVPLFTKKHRRSPSHYNLKYGRENSPPDSPVKEVVHITCEIESKEGLEVRLIF